MMKWQIKNWKEWKTSLTGVAMMVFVSYMLSQSNVNGYEWIAGMLAGGYLIGIDDSILSKVKKGVHIDDDDDEYRFEK